MKFKEQVTVKGITHELDKEDIIKVLKQTRPERVRKFYIEVEENNYPITQALYVPLKVPKSYISSNVALIFLTRIGFEVKERK